MSVQIFQTSNSKRWKGVKWTTRIILFVAVFLMAIGVLAVINDKNPSLPNLVNKARAYEDKLDPSRKLTFSNKQNKKFAGFKDFLEKKVAEDSIKKIKFKNLKLCLRFFY